MLSSTTAITAAPIKEARPAPAAVPSGPGGWDMVGAGLVVLLAFLQASFPARNSDVWMHLAAGRSPSLGADPFAHTTEGAYWVNHSWLYDWSAHLLYSLADGGGLVVFKALLVALLAGLMLRTCWQRGRRWIAALAIGLALTALGPYLALRPVCVSYLFLGVTFWWLESQDRPPSLRSCVALLLLFALWANLDEWFLLGPLTVGLYALGSLLQAHPEATRQRSRVLGLVALGGLLIGVANPHHVRAFTIPSPLDLSVAPELADELFGPEMVHGPFEAAYWQTGLALLPARVAFLALVSLGLLSLLAGRSDRLGSRAVVWLALLGLGAYRGAGIPFFAVVAGPVLSLNLQDLASRRAGTVVPMGRRLLVLRLATVLILTALVATAWPGWLRGSPGEPPRWTMESDPSLVRVAQQLDDWQKQGKVGDSARCFNSSPAVGDYLAWFCPGQRSFLDSRPHLFSRKVVDDFLAVRQGLLTQPAGASPGWRSALRHGKVTHLILHDPRQGRLTIGLHEVLTRPGEWAVVAVAGRATVSTWRDPAHPETTHALAVPPLDFQQMAFHPPEEEKAPAEWPGREPEPRPWWAAFWEPRVQTDLNRDEALVYLTYFDSGLPAHVRRLQTRWKNTVAAGTVGLSVPSSAMLGTVTVGAVQASQLEAFPPSQDKPSPADDLAKELLKSYILAYDTGLPGPLFLAVRAARRALQANPDDAGAHLLLGQAYLRLLANTQERKAAVRFPFVGQVRRGQAIAALKHAVMLRPDLLQAHDLLAGLYQEMGALDLVLQHRQDQLRCLRAAGARPAESAEQFARRVQELERFVDELGWRVRDLLNLCEVESFKKNPFTQARIADNRGLPGRALQVLLASDYLSFGREGALLELDLFLRTGRVKEIREWMEPAHEPKLGRLGYHLLQTQLAAATGDYARADAELQNLTPQTIELRELGLKRVPRNVAPIFMVGKAVLSGAPRRLFLFGDDGPAWLHQAQVLVGEMRQQADFLILRGILALEAGETTRAEALFRQGLSAWDGGAEGSTGLARHYLDLLTRTAGKRDGIVP